MNRAQRESNRATAFRLKIAVEASAALAHGSRRVRFLVPSACGKTTSLILSYRLARDGQSGIALK